MNTNQRCSPPTRFIVAKSAEAQLSNSLSEKSLHHVSLPETLKIQPCIRMLSSGHKKAFILPQESFLSRGRKYSSFHLSSAPMPDSVIFPNKHPHLPLRPPRENFMPRPPFSRRGNVLETKFPIFFFLSLLFRNFAAFNCPKPVGRRTTRVSSEGGRTYIWKGVS